VLLLNFALQKYVCNALKSSRNLTDRGPKTNETNEKMEILLMTLPEGWQLWTISTAYFALNRAWVCLLTA
jgi:hypothetical protein